MPSGIPIYIPSTFAEQVVPLRGYVLNGGLRQQNRPHSAVNRCFYDGMQQYSLLDLLLFPFTSFSLIVYNVAASTAPTALKLFLFVQRTSTSCAHSMYLAQPGVHPGQQKESTFPKSPPMADSICW
jgi:hypothetical protein